MVMTIANAATAPGPRKGIRTGEISILLATRGRPELLAQAIESISRTTAQKEKTILWVYVDEDDQPTRQAIDAGKMPKSGLPTHWHIGPRTPGLGETHQSMWNASGRASEVYMIASDKSRFDTLNWDEVIRAKFAEHPDGVLLAYAHDPNTADQATYPILGWGWLDALGYFFPGYFPFWFDDKWVDEIGRMAGRYVKLPIVIAPIAGRGLTQRMRGMPFWVRFFQLTLVERKDAARKLIAAMYPNDEAARNKALAAMESFATKLAKEGENYSDLYATFQEERHTAVPMEQRLGFDPLYFKQEARAVSQLIVLAQAAIARGEHSGALALLEGTHLSDLRVRSVERLKAECLRSLGRQPEADRINQEMLAAWPENRLIRRSFRFLAMFVNEAKRMVSGAGEKTKQTGGKSATTQAK
jgi:hypothetical protein